MREAKAEAVCEGEGVAVIEAEEVDVSIAVPVREAEAEPVCEEDEVAVKEAEEVGESAGVTA